MGKKKKHKNNHTSAMKQNMNVNTENAVSAADDAQAIQNDSGFSVAIEENTAAGEAEVPVPSVPPKGQEGGTHFDFDPPRRSFALILSLFMQRVINVVAIIVFIGSLIYLGQIAFSYIQSYSEYNSLENEYMTKNPTPTVTPVLTTTPDETGEDDGSDSQEVTEPATRSEVEEYGYIPSAIDFESLKDINEDVIAWIDIPGLDISYPVVLGDDNDYYLRHTFKGTYNVSGAIFFDSAMNANPNEQPNTLIYGHNQNNGKMFSNLHMWEDEAKAREDDLIVLYTPEEVKYYALFSVRIRPATDNAYVMNYSGAEHFQSYIDTAIEHSFFDFGRTVTSDDHIITLVTCCDDDNYRLVVHAVEIF